MVSIIVPTFNKLSRLKLMISSLENQTYKGEIEIIIVNNGSNDGTAEYLEQLKLPYRLKRIATKQTGRSEARNAGIKLAEGALLIFVDDDVLLCPRFIEEHVRLQSEPKVVHGKILSLIQLKFFDDPTKGILYSNVSNISTSIERLKEMCISEIDIREHFQEKIAVKGRMSAFEKVIHEVLKSDIVQSDWIGFTGGNVSVPKCWIEAAGSFDERFGRMWGCEDIELGYRLNKAGYPFIYGQNAVNYHMMHYREDYHKEHESVVNYFYEKHKDEKILQFQKFVEGEIKQDEFIKYLLYETL